MSKLNQPSQIARQQMVRLVESYNALGNKLASLERFGEAEAAFRAALQLDPDVGAVWNNLGNLFRVQARADEALAAYQRAIAKEPRLAAAYTNLGNALRERGKLPDAMAALRIAVDLDPTSATLHSNLAYAACFDPESDAQIILDEARRWADRFEKPLLGEHLPHQNDRDSNRRLKIGYVSADFRCHVIGRNVLPILEHHDRSAVEVHCFSTLGRHDEQTPEFIRAADRWHECGAMTDEQLAEKIRAETIDILVDLALHLSGNRLLTFARKPAPVQVTWAGYPGTTGLKSIDYRITDPYLDPPGTMDEFYSEQSVRLPNSFWCYRPMPGTPQANRLPALSSGYITFGCLNNPAKVNEKSLDLWAAVLLAVPQSRFVLLTADGSVRDEICKTLQSRGVDPKRLRFVGPTPPNEHLVRYHLIDISLDPLPYTGHTSTLDSLWLGVPVVTLRGETSVARGSMTGLTHVGLTDLITFDPRHYVAAAAGLATDIARLTDLRQTLRDRMKSSPICDEKQFARDMESAYRTMWRRWCA